MLNQTNILFFAERSHKFLLDCQNVFTNYTFLLFIRVRTFKKKYDQISIDNEARKNLYIVLVELSKT